MLTTLDNTSFHLMRQLGSYLAFRQRRAKSLQVATKYKATLLRNITQTPSAEPEADRFSSSVAFLTERQANQSNVVGQGRFSLDVLLIF